MISTNLQAKYAREDFEHSRRAKIRRWVEFINAGSIFFALGVAVAWVLS